MVDTSAAARGSGRSKNLEAIGETAPLETLDADGTVSVSMLNGEAEVTMRAVSLPDAVTAFLEANTQLVRSAMAGGASGPAGGGVAGGASGSASGAAAGVAGETATVTAAAGKKDAVGGAIESMDEFFAELDRLLRADGWADKAGVSVDRLMSLGPRMYGPNLLFNGIAGYPRRSLADLRGVRDKKDVLAAMESGVTAEAEAEAKALAAMDNSLITGFQLATLSGPMAGEPMMGVCFVVTGFSGAASAELNSGQVMSAMKEACRLSFLAQPCRLMMAMYTCDIQASSEVLGKVYAVLSRRQGSVLSEDMKEGSDVFIIEAKLPVVESFGFAEEMRKRASGAASPQLVFSHWEALDDDPFWVPTTEEELAHYGEKADSESIARRYMDGIRRRKGLAVYEKLVEHAEKQRNLGRNK